MTLTPDQEVPVSSPLDRGAHDHRECDRSRSPQQTRGSVLRPALHAAEFVAEEPTDAKKRPQRKEARAEDRSPRNSTSARTKRMNRDIPEQHPRTSHNYRSPTMTRKKHHRISVRNPSQRRSTIAMTKTTMTTTIRTEVRVVLPVERESQIGSPSSPDSLQKSIRDSRKQAYRRRSQR